MSISSLPGWIEKPTFSDAPSRACVLTRQSAWERFKQSGLPDKKHERFRYTDFSILNTINLMPATYPEENSWKQALDDYRSTHSDAIILVNVNGYFIPSASDVDKLSPRITILTQEQAYLSSDNFCFAWQALRQPKHYPIVELNTALSEQGIFLLIPDHCELDTPLHILSIATGDVSFCSYPKHAISVGENSQLTIIEHHITLTKQTHLINEVMSIQLHPQAKVNHYKVQEKYASGIRLAHTLVYQEKASEFNHVNSGSGGTLVREELSIDLLDKYATCSVSGIYYLQQSAQYLDHHIDIQHFASHTHSKMLYKGIIDSSARAVFNGRLYVAKDAQKMTAHQENHHLLLSNRAEANSKPELEIYADDVQCKHGATTGQIAEEALFYLQSRGISQSSAMKMLLHAFAKEVIDHVSVVDVQQKMQDILLSSGGVDE